jgi:hypothetical protein
MTVTLDTPPLPTWKVTCDHVDCRTWLYVQTRDEAEAAARAQDIFGWRVVDGAHWCKAHRRG